MEGITTGSLGTQVYSFKINLQDLVLVYMGLFTAPATTDVQEDCKIQCKLDQLHQRENKNKSFWLSVKQDKCTQEH